MEYAHQNGVATPFFITMTNLVKAIEDNYLEHGYLRKDGDSGMAQADT